MKIVNINEYGDEEMRKRLRKRIDEHEPELSDSLWDRIHHEMDQREANRKKRALWWLSSVAVVILASGIVTYSLFNSDVQNTIAQNTNAKVEQNTNTGTPASAQSQQANGGGTSSIPSTSTTGTEMPAQTNSGGGVSQPLNTAHPAAVNNTPGAITNNSETPGGANSLPPATENSQQPGVPPVSNTGKAETDADAQNGEAAAADEKADESANAGANANEKNDDGEKKNANPPAAKAGRQMWMVGVVYGLNSTYRTVTDQNLLFGYPGSKDRNKYEKPGLRSSVAFEISFFPVKNFFIRTGVGQYKTGEDIQYSITQKKVQVSGPPQPHKDSVITGDQHKLQNTYTFTQIPLEIGYSRTIAGKFSGFVSAGVAYNMVSSYTYNSFDPIYGDRFFTLNRQNYTGMVQNHLMYTGNAGVLYNVAGNFYLSAAFVYRKSNQSIIRKEEGVIVKPYSYGGTVGLNYKF